MILKKAQSCLPFYPRHVVDVQSVMHDNYFFVATHVTAIITIEISAYVRR